MFNNKKQIFNSLYSIIAILCCVLLGRTCSYFIPIIPGSLFGLIIFTLSLHFRLVDANKVKTTVVWGIKHMGVCFVPAGVGIINHFELVKQHGIAIVLITFSTTFILLTAIGLIYQRASKFKEAP